jgi:hypothetical protein
VSNMNKKKPSIAEWFSNLPESIPEEIAKYVDCEKALKTIVADDDTAFIFDGNLFDVHVVFNGDDGKTYLMMNGRMVDGKYHGQNFGDNVKVVAEWI